MKASSIVWGLILAVVVIGGWYWWSSQGNPQTAPTTPSTETSSTGTPAQGSMAQTGTSASQAQTGDGTGPAQNLTLGTSGSTKLGTYLIASNGMTLYTYGKDTLNKSNCTGQCAAAWPPYTISAGVQLNAQAGIGGKIGTITRADGATQISYNGRPLYFYAGDKTAGDTNGQGIGGVWYVVKP